MATPPDKKFEFRDWMDSLNLKASSVTSRFGISAQTVFNWRSNGVPPSRQEFVSRIIAEWTSGSAFGPRLVVHANEQQFRAWNDAANNCESGPKRLEDWVKDGLDELAREYFDDPQLKLPVRSHLKVAQTPNDPPAPERHGDISYRKGK